MIKLQGLEGVSAWLVYNKIVFSLFYIRRFNFQANQQHGLIAELKQCETLEQFQSVAVRMDASKYREVFFPLDECVRIFKASDDDNKKSMLLEALTITELTDEETLRLLALHKDPNGIKYSKANVGNIAASQIVPMVLDTLIACSNIQCDFSLMTPEDHELLGANRVDIRDEVNDVLAAGGNSLDTGNLISVAVKRVLKRIRGNHG